MNGMCLVKVGGSLLDLPDLRERLTRCLEQLHQAGHERLALLVGGGPTTDAIRALDATHHLGEATAHNLALRALTVNAHAMRAILNRGRIVTQTADLPGTDLVILDPWSLLDELEGRAGHALLPHTWQATSDSVSLVLAGELGIPSLVLLKSVGPSGPLDPGGRHPADIVDPCFQRLQQRHPGVRVAVIGLR